MLRDTTIAFLIGFFVSSFTGKIVNIFSSAIAFPLVLTSGVYFYEGGNLTILQNFTFIFYKFQKLTNLGFSFQIF